MTTAMARFEGDIPAHYDQYLGPVLFEHYATDLAKRAASPAVNDLLELAAGTGIVTDELQSRLAPGARIWATDLNGDMLRHAEKRLGQRDGLTLQTADAGALDFPDQQFDAIACQFGVMFFPDKVGAFKEALRVLKPGGRYVFNVWSSWETNPFAAIANRVIAPLIGPDEPSFYAVPFSYCDENRVLSDLAAAGFDDVSVETVSHEHRATDLGDFARGLVLGNPVVDQLHRNQGDVDAAIDALQFAFEDTFGSAGQIPLEAIVFEARR